MAKKKRPAPASSRAEKSGAEDKGATLKDLLSPDVVGKLKQQADQMKESERQKKEEARQKEMEARRTELKRLENDFEYLLNNSQIDWNKYKS